MHRRPWCSAVVCWPRFAGLRRLERPIPVGKLDSFVTIWPLNVYVTDGDRRMTFESAQAFGDRVRAVYEDLGYKVVEVPRDTVAARARFIAERAQHALRTT